MISDTFDSFAIIKKANIYFGGQAISHKLLYADGVKKTLGFMQVGDYEFGTEAPELVEIIGGAMDIKLANSDDWNTYVEGQAFEVEGNSKFSYKVPKCGVDYYCSYMPLGISFSRRLSSSAWPDAATPNTVAPPNQSAGAFVPAKLCDLAL